MQNSVIQQIINVLNVFLIQVLLWKVLVIRTWPALTTLKLVIKKLISFLGTIGGVCTTACKTDGVTDPKCTGTYTCKKWSFINYQ